MTMMMNRILLCAIALFASMNMISQDKQFTLEDLNFGGNNYRNMMPKNKYYTWWGNELIRQDMEECFIVDKKTGKEKVLLKLKDVCDWVEANGEKRPVRHLYSATFPYPAKSIVRVSNGHSYMLIDFKQKKVVWTDSISTTNARDWAAASKATAYTKNDDKGNSQLFVLDENGKEYQLSTDGSREIVYGESVHRNEFGIEKGTFWSPNGQRLAFYRMDQSMVADYPQVNIYEREATYEPDKYPMAGETSHKVTVGVFDLNTHKTIYLDAGEPTDRYFTNIAWGPDNQTIYMFELNRDQNDCRLVSYDAITGKRIKELYQEENDKYVEPLHPIVFLPWDSQKFIFQSQRDGFNHLYLFDTVRNSYTQLTKGEWVVMELQGFNEKSKSVIIQSNEASPIQKNTYAIDIKNGKRTLLDNGRGWHTPSLSDGGQYILDTYSEPDVPRVITVANTQTTKTTKLFVADDPWEGYGVPEYSVGTIKAADGVTDLYYRMVKPVNFDATKQYPTIVYVYGGPHAHNVDARWHYASRSWETYMAQKGYLLFILDNRGSENRGREFEQTTFRQLGQIEMQDQMKGVEYLKSLPYVDANRLGVHGWSFGGYMTISLMTNYPEVFKVGVAGGPVIDWKWYEVMYGERYMDTPKDNPKGYEKTSLIKQAKNLKGKLQIITGYNDNTVVPQHCLSFLAACIEAGTQPDFFAYPGEGHNMMGHSSVHLHERISQYFDDYLK